MIIAKRKEKSTISFARLQGIKDDFVFYGVKSIVIRQIGNMIDLYLSKAIGIALKKLIFD